tara:strand:- start:995 stop:1588 length:594 start_codon:yes stop_codon:yes gene_type:complete
MAIGFTATNVSTQVVPDRTLAGSSTANVRTAKFGDGYEQRASIGINNVGRDYSISFANRSKTEVDDIVAFFESKNGVTAFDFTIPDTNSTSATTGVTTGGNTSSSTTVTLTATNPDISVGALVTDAGSEVTGTVTVASVSGTTVTFDSTESIANNTTLTFTNQNERTIKVVCDAWNVVYGSKNFYSINTTFRRVYEP